MRALTPWPRLLPLACLLALLAPPPARAEATLYDALGGRAGIARIVDEMVTLSFAVTADHGLGDVREVAAVLSSADRAGVLS